MSLELALLGLGALFVSGKKQGALTLSNCPDIDPSKQGGNYSRLYDEVYFHYSQVHSVPFCLIKAHAYRESLQKPQAFRQEPNGKASYGLMQVLWWASSQRFQAWGYSDDAIGDGSLLYDPYVNVDIACRIIVDNFRVHGNLRDATNSYNTGRSEAVRPAPGNYVNDVLKVYETLLGRSL